MSRLLITELPACGLSRGGNYPKTLRGPVGKERPAGPRSHSGSRQTLVPSDRRLRPLRRYPWRVRQRYPWTTRFDLRG